MIVVAAPRKSGVQGRRSFLRLLAGAALLPAPLSRGATRRAEDAPSALFRATGAERVRLLERSWRESQRLAAVRTGPAAGLPLVQFIDPRCPLFARQWRALWPYRERLRIHWIPVAFVQPQSLRAAAAILASPHALDALAEAAARAASNASFPADDLPIPTPHLEQARANTRFWRERFGVLPLLLYRHPQGLRAIAGTAERDTLSTIWRAAAHEQHAVDAPPLPEYRPHRASP